MTRGIAYGIAVVAALVGVAACTSGQVHQSGPVRGVVVGLVLGLLGWSAVVWTIGSAL